MMRTFQPLRFAHSFVLAAGLLAGAAVTGSAVHAGSIPGPIPINAPCRDLPKQAQITISAPWTAVYISGSCFLGNPALLSVYDVTRGKYLGSLPVTVDSNGSFSTAVPGAHCYDQVEAIAYDTGWDTLSNQGHWQSTTVECTPK